MRLAAPSWSRIAVQPTDHQQAHKGIGLSILRAFACSIKRQEAETDNEETWPT